ncbi:MAG: hypothetical protein Sapg2KO_48700 [Saprospiraceae bacterium]
MPIIRLETIITTPIQIVFNLSRSIDLHEISTKQTNEKAIAGITSGLIKKGESVTWRAKHFGVYHQLTTKITDFKSPHYFVDEMEKGIFKSFKHEHVFEENEVGTLMKDVFDYQSPLGILGRLADRLFLKRYMTELLIKRNQTIKLYAESGQWETILRKPNKK